MKYFILILTLTISFNGWTQTDQGAGTLEDRKALFDYIIEKTKQREAWSPIKNKNLNFDPLESMQALEQEIIQADTEDKLFFALKKLSAARRDRHLSVNTVKGGITPKPIAEGQAPIRFFPDFSKKEPVFFVADIGKNLGATQKRTPAIGDRLVSINGEELSTYTEKVKAYTRHSTLNNFYIKAAYDLATRNYSLPASFFKEQLTLELKPKKGKKYTIVLDYLDTVDWTHGRVFNKYPGYQEVSSFRYESFKVYQPTDSNKKNLVLWWYGFRGDLPESIDALMIWAENNNKLDYNLIIDAIDSRGGSQGAYALARLSPKAFKTTGGNLKLSDITFDFIADYNRRYLSKKGLMDHDSRETEDDGTWAIDWLNGPVLKGLAAGQAYSNNTPFKCAHLPHYSDWIMQPAKKHFKGKMVAFFGPWGGSHLTQFSAMIIDNNLGYTMGMVDGGYSNTWEWTETLTFPGKNKPLVSFMWDIGHTIRPNGQIAEGNPPMVDEIIPVTPENYLNYKNILLQKAEAYLK